MACPTQGCGGTTNAPAKMTTEQALAKMEESAAKQRMFDVKRMDIERSMATSQAMANTANKVSDRMAQK